MAVREVTTASVPQGFVPDAEAPAVPQGFAPDTAEQYGPARSAVNAHGVLGGALRDTFGEKDRPGTKTPLGVVLKPENAGEFAVREMVAAPLWGASLPLRIGAMGAMGAATAAAEGGDAKSMGINALIDMLVAGVTEGVMGTAGKAAGRYATKSVREAVEALRSRLPTGRWFNIPALSNARMTMDEVLTALDSVRTKGPTYQQARQEFANELTRLDAQRVTGPKPYAGQLFRERTSKEATTTGRTAATAEKALTAPAARAAADVAATTPASDQPGDLPIGAVPIMGAIGGIDDAWRWLQRVGPRMIP